MLKQVVQTVATVLEMVNERVPFKFVSVQCNPYFYTIRSNFIRGANKTVVENPARTTP